MKILGQKQKYHPFKRFQHSQEERPVCTRCSAAQLRLSSVHIKTPTSLVVIRFAASQTCEDAVVLFGALRAILGALLEVGRGVPT